MEKMALRTAIAFALLSSAMFLAQIIPYPPDIESTIPPGEGTFNLSGIYWPSIGRDHTHRSEGIPAQRGITDPVVKWDHSSNSTSLGTVGANFTENIVFDIGTPEMEVFGIVSSNYTHLQLRDGENGTLMWSVDVRKVEGVITNRLYLSPAVVDTDADGAKEIFCAISDGNSYRGILYEPKVRLNGTGYHFDEDAFFNERVWIADAGSQGSARFSSPIAYDVTADGTEDILFGAGNYLVCIDGIDGEQVWQRQIGPLGEVLSAPAVYVAGSPALNRIAVNSLTPPTKKAIRTTVVNFNGVHLNNVTYDLKTTHTGDVPVPVVGDMTGDGEREIVCVYPGSTGSGRVRFFSYSLNMLNVTSVSGFLESSCAMSDVDDDGAMEVLLGSRFFTTRANIRMVCLELYRPGSEWISRAVWTTESPTQLWTEVYSSPMVCDLDADSDPDTIFFAAGSAICLDEDGKVLWNATVNHIFRNAGIVGDLGRDQFSDMLCDGILFSQRIVDLVVTPSDIVLSDPDPVEGKEVTISCIVTNQGNSPANNVLVRYTDFYGGKEIPIGNDTLAQVVQTRESTMRWTPASDGLHDLVVTVDPLDTITEDIETNNRAEIEIRVMSSVPDLNVSGIRFYRADGAEVDGNTKNLVDGDPSSIVASVVNLGYRAAIDFTVSLAIDGEIKLTNDVEAITGGASVNVSFPWTPDYPEGADVLVSVMCDLPKAIAESSESNNNLSEMIGVKSAEPSPASFILTGTVRDSQGDLVSGARVVLKDNRTGETLSQDTNLAGSFLMDPASLASSYLDGDIMEVRVTYERMWGRILFRVYSQDGGKVVAVNLTAIPTLNLVMDPHGPISIGMNPGTERKLAFNVTNVGNVRSQVSISVDITYVSSNSSGWIASANNSSFLLDPDAVGRVIVTLIVPSDAAPADRTTVLVACSINGTVLDSAELTVTVSEMAKLLIQMPEETEIVLDSSATIKEIAIYIENVGNVEVDYQVEMQGDLGPITTLTDGSGNLTPGESVEPSLTIDASGESGTLYGELIVRSSRASGAALNLSVEIVFPNIAVDGEIGAEPPGRALNEEITLSINVKNEGRTRLKAFDYAFFVDDVTLGIQSGTDLAAGASAVLVGSWTPAKEGRFVITVRLDPDDELKESNEDDNEAERAFTFYPDLVVKTGSVSDYRPIEGSKMTATVEIENRGAAGVGGYKITIGTAGSDPLFTKDFVKALSVGASSTETVDFTAPPKAGRYVLDIKVEVPAGSTDGDMTNNLRSEEIEVVSPAKENDLPFIIGIAVAILLLIAVALFLLIKFGVIARDRSGDGPEAGSPPPDLLEMSLEEPALEMKLESAAPSDQMAVTIPVEAEIVEAPELVGPTDGEEEGMIPEV
jgi:hypothetical protein